MDEVVVRGLFEEIEDCHYTPGRADQCKFTEFFNDVGDVGLPIGGSTY